MKPELKYIIHHENIYESESLGNRPFAAGAT